MQEVFYNKPSWFVYELPEKNISNVHGGFSVGSILQ